jgi:hypothetical protein
MRLEHNVMAGLNNTSKPMKVIQHGPQTGNMVITRAPMNGRLYNINTTLLNNKGGSVLQLSGVDPKAKIIKKWIMQK